MHSKPSGIAGRILIEVEGVPYDVAKEALRLAAQTNIRRRVARILQAQGGIEAEP